MRTGCECEGSLQAPAVQQASEASALGMERTLAIARREQKSVVTAGPHCTDLGSQVYYEPQDQETQISKDTGQHAPKC